MDQPDKNANKMTGFRKRQQLTKTNKRIFAWVAGASVVVTACAVLIQFLVQQLMFNQQIINDKTNAQAILIQNKSKAAELKKNVDELVANTNLAKVKTNTGSDKNASNLQVVLDALPTSNDGATFANSLSTVILPRSGVTIESIEIDSDDVSGEVTTVQSDAYRTLGFSVNIKGSYDQVQQTLTNLVRVIRPITITKLTLQGDGSNLTALISGVTYSVPAANVNLESITRKP